MRQVLWVIGKHQLHINITKNKQNKKTSTIKKALATELPVDLHI